MPPLMLHHYHDRIKVGPRDIRDHCSAATPDIAALSATRHRQSRNFTDNSKYIYDVLIPLCRANVAGGQERELGETIRALNDKRFAISAHISRWGSREIAADWEGYCEIARKVCDLVEEQLEIERKLCARALRSTTGPDASTPAV